MIPTSLTALRMVLLAVAALLTVSLLPRWMPTPDLLLVLVVAVALRAGTAPGALMGLAAGWLVDLLPPGGSPMGLTALMYAGLGALVGLAHRSVRASALFPLLSVLAAAVIAQLLRLLVALFARHPFDLSRAAWSVLLTTLIGAVAVPLLMRAEHALVARGLA